MAGQDTTRTEIKASFLLLGFSCSHESITDALGLQPSECWFKGERIGKATITRKDNGWRLQSSLPVSATVEEHAGHLMQVMSARAAIIRSMSIDRKLLAVAMYIYELDRPPIVLPANTIRQLSELGAKFDIDLYNF